jgi:hypothetical protein
MAKMTLVEKYEYNKSYYDLNSEKIQIQRKERKNSSISGRMLAIVGNAKARAKREGWDFNLTQEFLVKLWYIQEGLCAITKEPLTLQTEETRWKGTLVSLDRIDSEFGYTQDNVWLVCIKVNYAKGVQTYDEFIEMCKKAVENYKCQN